MTVLRRLEQALSTARAELDILRQLTADAENGMVYTEDPAAKQAIIQRFQAMCAAKEAEIAHLFRQIETIFDT